MECKGCGRYVSSFDNKGTNTIPICATCADTIVRQYANIEGDDNVINQHYHFGGSDTEKCYYCSEEVITHCIDCGKPLCEEHKYTIFGKDRCEQHNNFHMAKMAGKGAIGTVKGTFKVINWLGGLWGR